MKKKRRTQSQPAQQRSSVGYLISDEAYNTLCCSGYTSLDRNPEIITGCRKIATLISSMTIHLMSNTENGDQRIKNELSRHIDIYPNKYMTRRTWMEGIVMNMLLYGRGNAVVVPLTENGLLGDLVPIPASNVSFIPDGYGYKLRINGKETNPDDVLHFVFNPDNNNLWMGQGLTASISDVANNLKQAAATKKAFMSSKFQPSVIVKVDATVDEFATESGRNKLANDYSSNLEAGKPWFIPGDLLDIKEIRPMTLGDLAINDTVTLDKRTVAGILGVPPFVLGVGEFNAEEWDNFISGTIKPIAEEIEQELTRKLLLSDKWYWKFNVASLYSYDLQTAASVYSDLYTKGIVDGNEVREKISMSPREGLDQLIMLENYIPSEKIGDQLKLKQEG